MTWCGPPRRRHEDQASSKPTAGLPRLQPQTLSLWAKWIGTQVPAPGREGTRVEHPPIGLGRKGCQAAWTASLGTGAEPAKRGNLGGPPRGGQPRSSSHLMSPSLPHSRAQPHGGGAVPTLTLRVRKPSPGQPGDTRRGAHTCHLLSSSLTGTRQHFPCALGAHRLEDWPQGLVLRQNLLQLPSPGGPVRSTALTDTGDRSPAAACQPSIFPLGRKPLKPGPTASLPSVPARQGYPSNSGSAGPSPAPVTIHQGQHLNHGTPC